MAMTCRMLHQAKLLVLPQRLTPQSTRKCCPYDPQLIGLIENLCTNAKERTLNMLNSENPRDKIADVNGEQIWTNASQDLESQSTCCHDIPHQRHALNVNWAEMACDRPNWRIGKAAGLNQRKRRHRIESRSRDQIEMERLANYHVMHQATQGKEQTEKHGNIMTDCLPRHLYQIVNCR